MTDGAARLRFVAGKGGVGRTTVAAARAQQAAEAGRRTLAVDATGSGDLARLVGATGAADGPPGRAGRGRPTVLTLTTVDALDHYLSLYLPVPGLTTRAVGPSGVGPLARIFDYVATAAPGVREILVIGKIGWETLHGGWDDVVVDAPATGHLVELLDAPRAMAELVPVGPVADQSAWLRELLAGPTTAVELVTTLDELPVTESLELWSRLKAETSTTIESWILNRVPPPVSDTGLAEAERLTGGVDLADPKAAALADVVTLAVDRSRSAQQQRQRLNDALVSDGAAVVPVPEAAQRSAVVEAVQQALGEAATS